MSRTSSLTRPAWQTVALPSGSLAAVGMNTITPLQAARPKGAHLHNEQVPTGKELSGESPPHSASPVRVRQNTTLAMWCCVDSLVGWHRKDKRGTFPKCRLKHTEGEVRDSKLDTSTGCLIRKQTTRRIISRMIWVLVLSKTPFVSSVWHGLNTDQTFLILESVYVTKWQSDNHCFYFVYILYAFSVLLHTY